MNNNVELNVLNNYEEIAGYDLENIAGGGVISQAGDFVSKTWKTIYDTGRDFGRSVVGAFMS